MDQVNAVMQSLWGAVGPHVPRFAGALAIALGAWVVARITRAALGRAAAAARLDERLHSPGLGAQLAEIGHWLVWLFALPALLGTLQLDGLLTPVNAMMTRLMGFVPNLIGSAVVLAVGVLMARIIRQIVTGVLSAAGSERAAQKLGLTQALGDKTLAGLVGSVVFVLVLLPTVVAALQPLGLDAVTNPVSRLLEAVISLIPRLVSAAIILVVAALIGRTLSNLASTVLAGMGLDRLPETLGARAPLRIGGRSMSELAGSVVMLAVMWVALTQASEVLGFAVLTETVATLGGVLARLAAGVLVFAVGLWLALLAGRVVQDSGSARAGVLAPVVRGAILFFTAALALRQAGLPADIVAIAFGAVVGAVAIAVAVAAGVGGRHVAQRMLEAAVARLDAPAPPAAPAAPAETTVAASSPGPSPQARTASASSASSASGATEATRSTGVLGATGAAADD